MSYSLLKKGSGLLAVLFLCIPIFAGDGRKGEIRLTDGSVYRGEIIIKNKLRIVTWAEDELGIKGKEDLKKYGSDGIFRRFYGRERTFGPGVVKSIRLEPRPDLASREKPAERMERKWDWKKLAKFEDKREEISHEKVFIGKPFPVRELQAVVNFNSGETLRGSLDRTAVYIYPEDSFTAKKFVIRSKEKGEEGESFEDLVHVKSVRFLEKGTSFPESHRITFEGVQPDRPSSVWAISRQTLTRLDPKPVKSTEHAVDVSGVYGEGVFLAVRHNGEYVVGWRNRASEKLRKTAKKHVKEMRDYYNERKLLGVHNVPESHDVLTLVRLRRHVPETSIREHQPERFGLSKDSSLEFYRIGIWRWRHNPETNRMILVNRGSFFRRELPERGMDTPTVQTSPRLWVDKIQGLPRNIVVGDNRTEK